MQKYKLKYLNFILPVILVLSLVACSAARRPVKVVTAKPNIKRIPPKQAGDKPQLKTSFSKNSLTNKDRSIRSKTINTANLRRDVKSTINSQKAVNLDWGWPAPGFILKRFTATNISLKGIEIGGNEGTPILAAREGEVVYSGNSLRGYGNLIIIKHKKNYLTAYAHNRINMVKEGDTVKLGQRIAEMGQTGTDAVKLHFEVRYQGKPVDPQVVLPSR